MPIIVDVYAREVLDSRGNPTVEVEVTTESGAYGRAMVPSGASTGVREALELRDGDKARYLGKGTTKAVENVNTKIAPKIIGMDCRDQVLIDKTMLELDGDPFKKNLGANATLGVSMACALAAADFYGEPLYKYFGGFNGKTLPVPMCNVINGGSHADSTVDFQEFMIMPVGAKSEKEAVRMAAETFHALKSVLKKKGYNTNVGDEGGFAPSCKDGNEEPLELLVEAMEAAGYVPGKDMKIAMDVAASEFHNTETGLYELKKSGQGTKTSDEMIDMYEEWIAKYPIISIEDGLDEEDWEGWQKLTAALGGTASIKLCQTQDLRLILNPFYQTKAIQGVYDISPIFRMNAKLQWSSHDGKWGLRLNGNNIFNNKYDTRSVQGNQDYRMKINYSWASVTFAVIYKFGGYKEKNVKAVDTSRMGH